MKQSMKLLTSSETSEWYTPPEFTDAVRQLLGGIELDPASNWAANQWIQADRYFTKEDDGLSREWNAETIFLNPPYGKCGARSNQDIWARKLEQEYHKEHIRRGAVLLTKCVPGYVWWERLFRLWPVCFVEERIKFLRLNEQGEIVAKGKAKAGTNFWYLGKNTIGFKLIFEQFGRVVVPSWAYGVKNEILKADSDWHQKSLGLGTDSLV